MILTVRRKPQKRVACLPFALGTDLARQTRNDLLARSCLLEPDGHSKFSKSELAIKSKHSLYPSPHRKGGLYLM